MIRILSLLLLTYPLMAIELKSNKPPSQLAIKNADDITCDFAARLTNKKIINLKTEVFKASDLSVKHADGHQGIYVNVFDFLGFSFYLDAKKQLIIETQKEEVPKKQIKSFSKLPLKLATKAEFSTTHNKKSINLKEVILVCKP